MEQLHEKVSTMFCKILTRQETNFTEIQDIESGHGASEYNQN